MRLTPVSVGFLLTLLGLGCARQSAPSASAPVVQQGAGAALPFRPRLRVIGTNDFHGVLEPRPDNSGALRGGAAAVAGAIARARAECTPPACVSIVLDGGDMFQGTPASNLAYGRPVVDVYNAIGYTAAALGNHEFDWGQDSIRARM